MDKTMTPRMIATLLFTLFLSIVIGVLSASTDEAAKHRIQMLNKSGDKKYVFGQEITRIAVGDSIIFEPTDKGHNAVTIKGMLPVGATKIKTSYNKEVEITLTEPGIYGIKCAPHVGAGMIALIIVGDVSGYYIDLAKIKLPKKAKIKMTELLDQISS